MEDFSQVVPNFTKEQQEGMRELLKLINPYTIKKKISEMSYEELVKHLLAHDSIEARAILKVCTRQEINDLILTSVEMILGLVENWDEDKIKKLMRREGRDEVSEIIKAKHQEIFDKINNEISQLTEQSKMLRSLDFLNGKIKKSVSAIMSTEEEAKANKAEIIKAIDEYAAKTKESILDSEHQVAIAEKIESMKKESVEFVDVKLKEEPVKVYYYKTGNRVAVKLKWDKSSYHYTVGRGKEVRLNRGEDHHEYPHIVSVDYIMDFLCQNDIRDEDIWVDPRSIDEFYSFNNKVSVNLTPSFVAEWWNYDCPNIYRLTPNKYRHTNMMGMPICHFTNQLVESSWTADYIDEDITEQEFKALTLGHEDTRICKTIKSVLDARKIQEDEAKVSEIRAKVNEFDNKVQEVINNNENEILNFLKNEFKERVVYLPDAEKEGKKHDFRIDDNFGLDCGFINIQTTNKEYMDKRTLLRQLDKNVSPWMKVSLPYFSQSTTLNRVQFQKVKEIVERETGIELYAHTVLD